MTISLSVGASTISLWRRGNDILHGGGENDTLFGGGNDDVLMGDLYNGFQPLEPVGDDYLDGGDGNDHLDGGGGQNVLYGGGGNDLLIASGLDVVYGGAGDDVLVSDRNGDFLDGGAGNDQYVFTDELLVVCEEIGRVDGLGITSIRDASGTDTS